MSLLVMGGAALPVHAQVTGVTVDIAADGAETLQFEALQPIQPKKSFLLENPDRLVIDLPSMKASGVRLPKPYSGALVRGIRAAQFDDSTTRLVLDLKQPVKLEEVKAGAPLVVVLLPAAGKAPVEAVKTVKKPTLPLVIIDAGHGGHDPGALGKHGTHEKDVTLNYARALREALNKTGKYRAELTRDADRFIVLHERVAIARKKKGDLFISLHADSNPKRDARGMSVYTLSETASDDEAAALAEQENKSDIVEGIDLSTTDPDVASILIDLTQRETMNKSSRLADAIVASVHPRVTKLPKPHRFAGFRVLKSPDVPSVLIELGFLTNATDERLLLTAEHRDRVIGSIIKGIDRYMAAE